MEKELQIDSIKRATEVFKQIMPNAEGEMNTLSTTYLTADYRDSQGQWGEVRMRPDSKRPGVFNLIVNVGNGIVLLELKGRFEKEGIQIGKLFCADADEETQSILKNNSK